MTRIPLRFVALAYLLVAASHFGGEHAVEIGICPMTSRVNTVR